MSETNVESLAEDTSVTLADSMSSDVTHSSVSSNQLDDEARRRKILSKMWGKGNKSSHKVRELEKSSSHLNDSFNEKLSNSSTMDENSNSINMNKPLAVVKPIILGKSDVVSPSTSSERTRQNSETSFTTVPPVNETSSTTTTTVNEPSSASSNINVDDRSNKKKKSHSNGDSKKKKKSRSRSKERDRLHHHRHKDEDHRKTKTDRRNEKDKISRTDLSSSTSKDQEKHQQVSKPKEEKSSLSSPKDSSRSHRRSDRDNDQHHHHRHSPPSTKHDDRSTTKKDDRHPSTIASKSSSNSKASDTHLDNRSRTKERTHDEKYSNSSRTEKPIDISPDPRASINGRKSEKSNSEERSKRISSPRHHQRSSSRHRSTSKERKSNRKRIDSAKNSSTVNDSTSHRRRSSSDSHRDDRRRSRSSSERQSNSRHRLPSSHSYHHSRSTSSKYVHHYSRRSISPRSRYYRSRYNSSRSSSSSVTPRHHHHHQHRHRRSRTRSSSSSSIRSSSSYSSISRTSSSSRSRSRTHHYSHQQKKFRRSPTLEKLFLKASESIESVSTQKNPNASSSSTMHLVPLPSSSITSDLQMSPSISSLTETNAFYGTNFAGFSAPPPPFLSQPQQRFLKEITTDSSTARRSILNEVQFPFSSPSLALSSSTITNHLPTVPSSNNADTNLKPILSNDPSSGRPTPAKPPRTSRFSDLVPSIVPQPSTSSSSVDIPVDADLNYLQITENINCLPASRRQQKRHNREVMECECTTSEEDRARGIKACGSECLNRMLLIECGPMCPCGPFCTNRRFQRRSYATHKLVLFKTDLKGYGIRTTGFIRKGRFLVEYVGEVIDMDELARRTKKYKREGLVHQYIMSLIHGTVIDSTVKGNWARFINHSCEPNCTAEKWLVNGEYRMGFFAKRDLNPGEEITIDYRFETFGTSELTNEKCYCGAPSCRGTISLKTNTSNTNGTPPNNTMNNNHSNKKSIRRPQLDDDELLVYLRDEDTNEYLIPKNIDEIRQLIQIMSRTDSENIRSIELDLLKHSAQKQPELPRLFLECNGLHVLSSWLKDILIDNDNNQNEQQYSIEFQCHLLDFLHHVLPIKDRTTVVKHGLLDLIKKKIQLPSVNTEPIHLKNQSDNEQIKDLIDSMLNHLDHPIMGKLFDLYTRWSSLKERFIIPKRKEPLPPSDHHHHNHHHHRHSHSSKHSSEENSSRHYYSSRSSSSYYSKSIDRPTGRRSFNVRDLPKNNEEQLSRDERRRLFEQQYEDEERARAAAAAAVSIQSESPENQNEPPQKKQRKSDSGEPVLPGTSPHSTDPSKLYAQSMDHMYWIHQQLSQIPLDYIRAYVASIDPSSSTASHSNSKKDEPPVPPPPQPVNEAESARIIRLPVGWSVGMCAADSSVYFYNSQTMTSSWIPPPCSSSVGLSNSNDHSHPTLAPLDLSPLSSAHIVDHQQHRSHSQHISSSSRAAIKSSKHPHRHSRSHRHHHHHHHHLTSSTSVHKRKRPSGTESTATTIKEESNHLPTDDLSTATTTHDPALSKDTDDPAAIISSEEISITESKVPTNDPPDSEILTTVETGSEANTHLEDKSSSDQTHTSGSSIRANRDLLRKHISQHVHATLKPYTKKTCKQGRIASADDMKYLVKKFTLAVLDKEIEKAKNDGVPLSPILTDRVRLKTEVYVRKYMHKMGSVFQRHDPSASHGSSNISQAAPSSSFAAATETTPETMTVPSSSAEITTDVNENSMNPE